MLYPAELRAHQCFQGIEGDRWHLGLPSLGKHPAETISGPPRLSELGGEGYWGYFAPRHAEPGHDGALAALQNPLNGEGNESNSFSPSRFGTGPGPLRSPKYMVVSEVSLNDGQRGRWGALGLPL
jgi:hypothetical protein